MTIARTRVVVCAAGAAVVVALAGRVLISQASSCGMQLNTAPIAFCETFDNPFPVTNRSGQLNGVLWGVSRVDANDDGGSLNEGWLSSTLDGCNGPQAAQPDGSDVIICNGQVRESVDDDHGVSGLAMYPRQPFDFAGRTGTAAFDVTNDNYGTHSFWPEFWITDQPTPVPFQHGGPPCDLCSLPRNGIGITFAGSWPGGMGLCANEYPTSRHWIVDGLIIVQNYVPMYLSWLDNPTSIQTLDCASESTGANGSLNHIEVRVSTGQVDVWATDAGSTVLKHLSSIPLSTLPNASLTFTRGLVWIEDAHYNAAKSDAPITSDLDSPNDHTFTWDNVAFDGPALNRDLSFDVLDSLVPMGATASGANLFNLGWWAQPSSPVTLHTLPVTAANIAAASASLLMFNFGYNPISTFSYTINGFALSAPSPITPDSIRDHSVALPVPLADLVPGVQTIVLSGNQPMTVSNVNLVLAGAGGPPPLLGAGPAAPLNLRIQ